MSDKQYFRIQFMKAGPTKLASSDSLIIYKTDLNKTDDELRKLIKDAEGAIFQRNYVNVGGHDQGETDGYEIWSNHPNYDAFKDIYNTARTKNSYGGRRRPSRKYKKSKRVLRRKSRSTRRR